jgi:hypothetical protein
VSAAELNSRVVEQLGAGNTVAAREALKAELVAVLDALDRNDKGEQQVDLGSARQIDNFVDGISPELERFLAVAVPLVEYGGDAGHEAVVNALARVAEQIPRETQTPGWETALYLVTARLLWSTTALALACDRIDFLPRLLRLRTRSRFHGGEELLVDDSSARHLSAYERGADESFDSHNRWLADLPLCRERYPLLVREGLLEQALAEADMLFAMHSAGDAVGSTYSHGARREGHAERRLRARVNVPAERAALCTFFNVSDAHLEDELAALHGQLARSTDLFIRDVQLFPTAD